MSDIFHSSKYVIERAKHHITDFERQVKEFIEINPYSVIAEIDPDTSYEVHKIKLVKPMPVHLPGIAFDTVNNLRSALDQAVFALNFGKGGRFAAFPFASDATHFESAVKGRCKNLPKEIVDLIRTFQPYKGGNDLLWALNEVCNTDKHAIICPVAFASTSISINGTIGSGFLMPARAWDRAKNEMELFRQHQGGVTDADFKITYFIAMQDVEFIHGKPANTVLRAFMRVVEGIVLALEAEARRLKLI